MFHGERFLAKPFSGDGDVPPAVRLAVEEELGRFLDLNGSRLPEKTQNLLSELALMVASWGSGMNLSGYRDPVSVMRSLVCDALGLWFSVITSCWGKLANRGGRQNEQHLHLWTSRQTGMIHCR